MIFEHEKSYVKQIVIYLKNKNFAKALELSTEFVECFPNSLISHYLLAKSYYWNHDFVSALSEGHRAFNLADSEDDLIGTGIFLACVYYELRRYSKGMEILHALAQFENEKVEKAMFILSLCINDPTEALMHVDALYKINKQVANEFVDKFLELAKEIEPAPT